MKKIFIVSFMLCLASLNFVLAEGIPKLEFSIDNNTLVAVITLGVALVLIFIYWILQSKMLS